jgi:gliding motility-associated-like protein
LVSNLKLKKAFNMRLKFFFSLIVILAFQVKSFSQELIISEISQGPGVGEYVELVVGGSPACDLPLPCLNLRTMIFDDNNGHFGVNGITTGAMRFADIPFWDCIRQGTIIVIYDNGNKNAAIPEDDESMSDNNGVLIIPANSQLLESTIVSPTSTPINIQIYPPNANWVSGGNWYTILMSDTEDAFQLPADMTGTNPSHAVQWGTSTTNSQIFFSGTANNKVFYLSNVVSNDPRQQNNWVSGDVGINESPGLANSQKNLDWIKLLTLGGGSQDPIEVVKDSLPESCPGSCDGLAEVVVTGGYPGYTYSWSNGDITTVADNLCPGIVTVTITDSVGCTAIRTVEIQGGTVPGGADFEQPDTLFDYDLPNKYSSDKSQGYWYADCGACLDSATGVFDPQVSGAGTFVVCHVVGRELCIDTICQDQVVRANCSQNPTYEEIPICDGVPAMVFGNEVDFEGKFFQLYVDQNGCDSTHTIVTFFLEDCGDDGDDEPSVEVPNVFSPNEDGVNDLFEIKVKGGKLNESYIVNRWGNVVFTIDPEFPVWDGKNQNGTKLNQGTYFYIVNYEGNPGEEFVLHGFISLYF